MIAYQVLKRHGQGWLAWGPKRVPQWDGPYHLEPYGWGHVLLATRFRRYRDAATCAYAVGGFVDRVES